MSTHANSSNRIVQSLWIDDEITDLQRMCYNSFRAHGHLVKLYSYGQINNLPQGVVLCDANEILPFDNVFRDQYNSYATFSDWFRIALLNARGGWWVDSDVICLKHFHLEDDYAFATEQADQNGNITICNAVIKSPANAPLLLGILADIGDLLKEKNTTDIQWTEIGAGLLTKHIVNENRQESVLDPAVFCPINFFDYKNMLTKEAKQLSEEAYAIHLWNKMWDWFGMEGNLNPAENSLMQTLRRTYLS